MAIIFGRVSKVAGAFWCSAIKGISISKLDDLMLKEGGFRDLVQANRRQEFDDTFKTDRCRVQLTAENGKPNFGLLVGMKRLGTKTGGDDSRIRLDILVVQESKANLIQILRHHHWGTSTGLYDS
jgi:hypothetical protein